MVDYVTHTNSLRGPGRLRLHMARAPICPAQPSFVPAEMGTDRVSGSFHLFRHSQPQAFFPVTQPAESSQ